MTSAAYLQEGHLGRDLYQGLEMPGTWKGLNTFKSECCVDLYYQHTQML